MMYPSSTKPHCCRHIPRLGNLLCQRGLITRSQLHRALRIQQHGHQPLGKILIGQSWITRRQLYACLARQWLARMATLITTLGACTMQQVHCDPADNVKAPDLATLEQAITHPPGRWNLSTLLQQEKEALSASYSFIESTGKEITLKLKEQLGTSMTGLLRGQHQGGVDQYSEGMRYQAIWSSNYLLMEVKYQF
jgi:hypothetical protein